MELEMDEMIKIMRALSNVDRVDMLFKIANRKDVYAAQFNDEYYIEKGTILNHLTVLSRAGLIKKRKEGKFVYLTVNKEIISKVEKSIGALA